MEYLKISHDGKEYGQIACKECQSGIWLIGTDDNSFVAKCYHCKRTVLLTPKNLKDEPDKKAIPLRFFS